MVEEVRRETATSGESPRGLISPEFFFLLQRIDRLDEKFTGEINKLDEKLNRLDEKLSREIKGEINKLDEKLNKVDEKLSGEIKGEIRRLEDKFDKKMDGLKFWAISSIITVIVGFVGTIITVILTK